MQHMTPALLTAITSLLAVIVPKSSLVTAHFFTTRTAAATMMLSRACTYLLVALLCTTLTSAWQCAPNSSAEATVTDPPLELAQACWQQSLSCLVFSGLQREDPIMAAAALLIALWRRWVEGAMQGGLDCLFVVPFSSSAFQKALPGWPAHGHIRGQTQRQGTGWR